MTQLSSTPDAFKAEGLRLFQQGRIDASVVQFEAAAAAYREQDDLIACAEMWNNIAVAQRRRKRSDDAINAINQALSGFREAGDVNRQGQALANLADIYAAQGDSEQAASCFGKAAETLAQSGDRARQSQVLRALSLHHLRQARFPQAMLIMEQSLSVRPRIGVGGWLFRWLLRLALRLSGLR